MICIMYKLKIERELDDYGKIQSPIVLKHIDSCPVCQRHLDSLKNIQAQLKASCFDISDGQMQQVQSSIYARLSNVADTNKAHKIHHITYAIGAVAAMLIIVTGLFSMYLIKANSRNQDSLMASVMQISGGVQYQMVEFVGMPERMLATEMQNMQDGVRGAIGFVRNCLPQSIITENLEIDKELHDIELDMN